MNARERPLELDDGGAKFSWLTKERAVTRGPNCSGAWLQRRERGRGSDGGHGCRRLCPRSPTSWPWRAVTHLVRLAAVIRIHRAGPCAAAARRGKMQRPAPRKGEWEEIKDFYFLSSH
ncbi:hypothetical protein SETIT_2G392000v2 [Setaria italica]|uniref:Uncharacterized protein n=2 Tax=Setaria TaxID=4554 RepID=A0A368Q9R0_SETIT|nr:hypothetical protein SETIT_2G392000v2 [Setaria italica]TKW35857.1 hypothetical protein SEVIR_2G402700v2 [Setaria viridis]